jgi:hypothetical protein
MKVEEMIFALSEGFGREVRSPTRDKMETQDKERIGKGWSIQNQQALPVHRGHEGEGEKNCTLFKKTSKERSDPYDILQYKMIQS